MKKILFIISIFVLYVHAQTLTISAIENNITILCDVGLTKNSSAFKMKTKWNGWGEELKLPIYFIENLKVKYKNESLYIPMSAYVGLGNPSSIKIVIKKEGSFNVEIYGGDASTSYMVTLIFENNYLKKRIVRHQEFPESSWEITEYHFNTEEFITPK